LGGVNDDMTKSMHQDLFVSLKTRLTVIFCSKKVDRKQRINQSAAAVFVFVVTITKKERMSDD
jgi:hypothetical protein